MPACIGYTKGRRVEITGFERAVGKYAQDIFGPNAFAKMYGDDTGEYEAMVLHGPDCPVRGVTSYSTVGLSNFHQLTEGTPVRVEIVGVTASIVEEYALTLTSCFFEHVKNSTNIIYGSVIPNIVGQYQMSATMKHFTFVSPFLWEWPTRVEIMGRGVYWLYAIPISEAERLFIVENGIEALENIFEAREVDHYDIHRESVV